MVVIQPQTVLDRPDRRVSALLRNGHHRDEYKHLGERIREMDRLLPASGWPVGLEKKLLCDPDAPRVRFDPIRLQHQAASQIIFDDHKGFAHLLSRPDVELAYAALHEATNASLPCVDDVLAASRIAGGVGALRTGESYTSPFPSGEIFRYLLRSKLGRALDEYLAFYGSADAADAWLPHTVGAFVDFVSIHPFQDGNGRVARLLSQLAMQRSLGVRGVCWPIGPLMAHHREQVVAFTLAWLYDGNLSPALAFFSTGFQWLIERWEGTIKNN